MRISVFGLGYVGTVTINGVHETKLTASAVAQSGQLVAGARLPATRTMANRAREVSQGRAMLFEQNSKARTISLSDPEHQFRVEIQSCCARAYDCPNPFGHSRLLRDPK